MLRMLGAVRQRPVRERAGNHNRRRRFRAGDVFTASTTNPLLAGVPSLYDRSGRRSLRSFRVITDEAMGERLLEIISSASYF